MSVLGLRKNEIDMTEGKIFPKIIAFAIPLLLTAILQLLFNTADIIVLGKFVGNDAMGAVGATSSLNHLIINLGIGLSVGSGVVISNAYGAKNSQFADRVLHTSMILSVLVGVGIGAFGFLLSPSLLALMNTPDNFLNLSALYMKIIFIGLPFNLLYNFGASILRAVGDTKRPLIFLTIAGIINIIVNIFSVTVLKMGVDGVALATITSQAVSAVLVVITLIKNKGFVRFSFKKLKIDKMALREIVRLGVPTGIQNSLFSITNVLLQSAINGLGVSEAITGSAVSIQIEAYIYTIISSVGSTVITAIGQNYGAKNFTKIKQSFIICLILCASATLVSGSIVYLFHEPVSKIIVNTNESPEKITQIIEFARQRMQIVCVFYFLDSIMEISTFALRGMGKSLLPTFLVFMGTCVFRVIWIYCIFPLDKSLTFLLLLYPISWTLTFVPAIISFFIVFRKEKKRFNSEL